MRPESLVKIVTLLPVDQGVVISFGSFPASAFLCFTVARAPMCDACVFVFTFVFVFVAFVRTDSLEVAAVAYALTKGRLLARKGHGVAAPTSSLVSRRLAAQRFTASMCLCSLLQRLTYMP